MERGPNEASKMEDVTRYALCVTLQFLDIGENYYLRRNCGDAGYVSDLLRSAL